MSPSPLPSFYDSLEDSLRHAFAQLGRGVADRRASFHTPALATVDASGRPAARTVVLRGFDPERRTLRFHTDLRSRKAAEIAREPRVSLHFYDAGLKLQLRCDCRASVERLNETALAAWRGSRPMSRACYAQAESPGAPIASPNAAELSRPLEEDAAYANFIAVICLMERMEWLYLASAGHRRALFDWTGAGPAAVWLAP